jgi:hypothetical protein
MSEQQLTNKSILQQVDVKYYICNVVKRKIYNFKFTKKKYVLSTNILFA